MIKQCNVTEIESRSQCNPYDKTGFLPIIVSPMYSCIDKHNVSIFLNNKIKVCMPRGEYMDESYQYCKDENYFDSYSLADFIKLFIDTNEGFLNNEKGDLVKTSVCIDTAAGHLKVLHDAIKKAKEIHGDKLVIMAGNVASVEAFVELAKTGVDYIRVGIGGGAGCNTTSNTGVGQEDLEELVSFCSEFVANAEKLSQQELKYGSQFLVVSYKKGFVHITPDELQTLSKVKIVADGISSYIKQCETKYGFNDNGYAAINKLLFAGADLVMVGKLFAQCLESAGTKGCFSNDNELLLQENKDQNEILLKDKDCLFVKYSGMSTLEEQKKYKDKVTLEQTPILRPSEGSVSWIPVRWTLGEWLNGSENQDAYPYLMGFENALRSAMSYTGAKTLEQFKNGK